MIAHSASSRTLNLGILAHVDAGKTTLTERLLHLAGVVDEPGSVDAGTTRTDTLVLERRRGITIKAAVVSFPLAGGTVNVVDTPGHPDFIAEVERVARRARRGGAGAVGRGGRAAADPDPDPGAAAARRTDAAVRQQDRPGRGVAGPGAGGDPAPPDPGRAADGRRRRCRARGPRRFVAHRADDVAFRDRETAALAEHDDALLAAYVEGRQPRRAELRPRPGGPDPRRRAAPGLRRAARPPVPGCRS